MQSSPSSVLAALGRAARKIFVSGFVIFTFLIYAVHERLAGPGLAVANGLASAPRPSPTAPAPTAALVAPNPTPLSADLGASPQPTDSQPVTVAPTGAPTVAPVDPTVEAPTAVPPTTAPAGQYKNGQFTGPRVDAFYGFVQVQAVIQNGQIADVKFLEFPSDRRTSQRINAVAVPYLTSEAIQAQSANVDIISGATLTSEAFAQSLQTALQNAAP